MPDTSGTSGFSSLPSISDIGLIAGTFVGGLITALGLRKGGVDKDKPAPSAETAGPMGLIVEESLLREMLDELRTISTNQQKFRIEDDARRREELVDDLKGQIADLKQGQRQTHGTQDDMAETLNELLRRIDGVDPATPRLHSPKR